MTADPAPPTLQDMIAWVERHIRQEAKARYIYPRSSGCSRRVAIAEAVAALLRRVRDENVCFVDGMDAVDKARPAGGERP